MDEVTRTRESEPGAAIQVDRVTRRTPEKFSDRLHRAAIRLVERNRTDHAAKIVGDLEFLHTAQEAIDAMSDDDYPLTQRLNVQAMKLRTLITELRNEAQQQPADGLFSEGIVVTKVQVALRIEEILSPPPPEPSRGNPR